MEVDGNFFDSATKKALERLGDSGLDGLSDREFALVNVWNLARNMERIERSEHLILFKLEGKKLFAFGMALGGVIAGIVVRLIG